MFYGLFFSFVSLSSVIVLTYHIQLTTVDSAMYAISPVVFEQALYSTNNGEWTFNRRQLVTDHQRLLHDNLHGLFEPLEIHYTFYTIATLQECDELVNVCDGVMIHIAVDYSLFIQERVYRYELHRNG